jgi:hypothetical protein
MQRLLSIPPIAHPWPGQGGIYAGVCRGRDGQPDHHLILALAKPLELLAWAPALDWASKVEADGHTDFAAPDRWQSAALYANVAELFEPEWHWTGTQYSAGNAFLQDFNYGYQNYCGKKFKARVRAVRRLPVNPSILYLTPEAAIEVAA